MKAGKFTIAILASSLIFTACSKDNVSSEQEQQQGQSVSAQTTSKDVYASSWMQNTKWATNESSNYRLYSASFENPELTTELINNGVVLTYAKINMSTQGYTQFSQPTMMPFYFLPPYERVAGTYYWYGEAKPGAMTVNYRVGPKVEAGFPESKTFNDFQFRYFVISNAFLANHRLTREQLMEMSYQDVVQLLGVSA